MTDRAEVVRPEVRRRPARERHEVPAGLLGVERMHAGGRLDPLGVRQWTPGHRDVPERARRSAIAQHETEVLVLDDPIAALERKGGVRIGVALHEVVQQVVAPWCAGSVPGLERFVGFHPSSFHDDRASVEMRAALRVRGSIFARARTGSTSSRRSSTRTWRPRRARGGAARRGLGRARLRHRAVDRPRLGSEGVRLLRPRGRSRARARTTRRRRRRPPGDVPWLPDPVPTPRRRTATPPGADDDGRVPLCGPARLRPAAGEHDRLADRAHADAAIADGGCGVR